ncbi:hypothetical protein RCCS2_12094 [Roseobacter sp. CCS2]|nr:hypothetical protein RCCS2_12094 [Roseobacter sp. CCS2]
MAVLTACASPLERCIDDVTYLHNRETAKLDRLASDIDRGYRLEDATRYKRSNENCENIFARENDPCWAWIEETYEKKVPVNISAARRELAAGRAEQNRLQPIINQRVAACRRTHPE